MVAILVWLGAVKHLSAWPLLLDAQYHFGVQPVLGGHLSARLRVFGDTEGEVCAASTVYEACCGIGNGEYNITVCRVSVGNDGAVCGCERELGFHALQLVWQTHAERVARLRIVWQ